MTLRSCLWGWLFSLAGFLCGCSKASSQRITPLITPSGRTLRVAAFPDYLARSVLEGFESRTGNKLVVETYHSNEELLERLAQGIRYDVVMPSSYAVERLVRKGQLLPMERERVENLVHVPMAFRNPPFDPGLKHCAPYVWSLLGLGIVSNREAPGMDPDRWSALFAPTPTAGARALPRVVMLDDMRATIGVALRALGLSASSQRQEDLLAAQKLLLEQLPRVQGYVEDSSIPLRQGETSLALAWSTELFDLMRRRPDLRFVIPIDGTLLYVDYLCVPQSAEQREVAFAFLNYLLEPLVAAETTNATMLATANQGARRLLETEGRWMWGTFDSLTSRSRAYEVLSDVGPALPAYESVWQTVKTALAAQNAQK